MKQKHVSFSPSPTTWQETLLSRSPSCRGNTDLRENTNIVNGLINQRVRGVMDVFQSSPFSSLMVAYWLLASGQDERLHNPVRLYSFRQKFWLFVLEERRRHRAFRIKPAVDFLSYSTILVHLASCLWKENQDMKWHVSHLCLYNTANTLL